MATNTGTAMIGAGVGSQAATEHVERVPVMHLPGMTLNLAKISAQAMQARTPLENGTLVIF